MQSVLDAHDTPSRASASPSREMRSTDQDDPSHRSTSGLGLDSALYASPTATQALVDGHDTDDSHPDQPGAPGVGVGSVDQFEPLQCSTSGTGSFVTDRSWNPTATQSRVDAHDTAFSPVSCECAGVGTGWIDQPAAAAGRATAATTTPAPTRSIS